MSQSQINTPLPGPSKPLLEYDGRISEMFGIFLLNLLLTIVTLGIYRFWAITRIRRYLWSHMRFQGTRFTYTGKGKEIFYGFLLAMTILGLAFSAVALVAAALVAVSPFLAIAVGGLAYIAMFILFGAAHFSAQRYRLSRTEWRGIRGGMEGSALRYGVAWWLLLLAAIFTLYQAVPWMQVGLARRRISASRFGSAAFQCDARAGRLYLPWLGTILGCFILLTGIATIVGALEWPTLAPVFSGQIKGFQAQIRIQRALPAIVIGLLAFSALSGLLATWYWGRLARLLLSHTTVTAPGVSNAVRFQSMVSARGLLWLFAGNALIALLTLGFGLPIVLHRSVRYLVKTTLISGDIDTNALLQTTLAAPGIGEGFLQALDPGVI